MCFSTNKIIRKEFNNLQVKIYFPQDEREKAVIKWGKELGDVKHKDASWKVFDPTWVNDVYQRYACICCRLKLESSKLTLVDGVVGYCMELESIANDFFN